MLCEPIRKPQPFQARIPDMLYLFDLQREYTVLFFKIQEILEKNIFRVHAKMQFGIMLSFRVWFTALLF